MNSPEASVTILLILLFVYFAPSVVAAMRQHHNLGAIIATNLLLGWTGLGWAGALIWSLTAVKKPRQLRAVDTSDL